MYAAIILCIMFLAVLAFFFQALEYHGCYYHGHQCEYARWKIRTDKDALAKKEDWKRRFEWTAMRKRELKDQGVEVQEIWECEFRSLDYQRRKWFDAAKQSIEDYYYHKEIDAQQMVNMVAHMDNLDYFGDPTLFGVMNVDIQVALLFNFR